MLCHIIRLYSTYTLMEKWMTGVFITILWQAIICLLSTAIRFTKKTRRGMNIKWRHAIFGLISSKIHLPRSLAWKFSLKSVMTKVITETIGPKTPTSKNAVMMEMGKGTGLMWKLLIFLGMMHHKALCTIVTRRMLQPYYFICHHFQKGEVNIIFPWRNQSVSSERGQKCS